MAVAAGRSRPLAEPQMEPSVSYLACACDLSYIHICRLLSKHSATGICLSHWEWKRASLIEKHTSVVVCRLQNSDSVWLVCSSSVTINSIQFCRIHFYAVPHEVGRRLCLSTCLFVRLFVSVFISRISQR